jgi:hypothetical protein
MQYLYSQCRYMAVDVLNATQISETEQLWTADVYCTADGSMWLWLRWLPLRFTAYSGYVEFANATNATAVTPVGTFTNHIPAGWYLDPLTKAVFRVPEANLTLLSYVASLSAQLKALKAELNKSRADANQTASLIAKLEAQLTALEAQRRALEEALRQRESEAAALQANLRAAQAENDRLKSQLAQLKAENDQLKAKARLHEPDHRRAERPADVAEGTAGGSDVGRRRGAQPPDVHTASRPSRSSRRLRHIQKEEGRGVGEANSILF